MRTTERLRGLKAFIQRELCQGRQMKAPAENMDIGTIVRREPNCFLAWAPARLDQTGQLREDTLSVAPGIIIMPSQSYAKYMEEHRFDRYNNVHRPSEMGQHLAVSILFIVYEPGERQKGFIDSVGENGQGLDMTLVREATETGLMTLMGWMDDCMEILLGEQVVPNTDMYVEETTMTYSLYTDQKYVVDRRPLYYGFINVTFGSYANEAYNDEIDELLR